MTETSQEDQLFDEAVDLLIRLQNDPHNPVATAMVRQWLARGAAHEAAWREATLVHDISGRVLTTRRPAVLAAPATLSRRRLLIGSSAAAAAVAGGIFGPGLLLRLRADVMTTTAEIRTIALPQGGLATLGPRSAIALAAAGAGDAELIQGMAYFESGDETASPLRIKVGDLTATATAGAFDASLDGGLTTIAVAAGPVDLLGEGDGRPAAAHLQAGQSAVFTQAARTLAIADGDRIDQVASWRNGMIFADREPVAVMVAKLARWCPGRVVMAQASLGEKRISGVFDTAQPIEALQAVVHPFQGTVRQLTPYLTVISTI